MSLFNRYFTKAPDDFLYEFEELPYELAELNITVEISLTEYISFRLWLTTNLGVEECERVADHIAHELIWGTPR